MATATLEEQINKKIEHYAVRVKTGKDLIDLGIIPKDSSSHLSLICAERLKGLVSYVNAMITPSMLGSWIPAITTRMKDLGAKEIDDPKSIDKYATEGMNVRGKKNASDAVVQGLEGKIRESGASGYKVDFDNKGAPYITWVKPNEITLLVPNGRVPDGLGLAPGVVADPKKGHFVRMSQTHKGGAWDSNPFYIKSIEIPATYEGMLIGYDAKEERVTVNFDKKIDTRNIYTLKLSDMIEKLEVSSLGQFLPRDREEVVFEDVLEKFFPTTILDTKRAYRSIVALIMGKDTFFIGPPGSGKTNITKDINSMAMTQGPIFIVEGCQSQCNPFSLFDPEYAKTLPPCAECMIKYCPEFQDTGHFVRPRPEEVKVKVARYGSGFGIESVKGSPSWQPYHFIGGKLPKLDGTTSAKRESVFDPEGYHAGIFVRTNNGILFLSEADQLNGKVLDSTRDILEDKTAKPEQLRFEYPAHSLIIGTANDHTRFSAPINDRVCLLAIRYPEGKSGIDKRHRITVVSYHKEFEPLETIAIPDTHVMKNSILRNVPMPVTLERAVDAFYMKMETEFPQEKDGKKTGKNEIFSSNRSKLDALDAARAMLYIDQHFFTEKPKIVSAEYAARGIHFALCTRIKIANRQEEQMAKEIVIEYVNTTMPEMLQQEEDNWWCNTFKHIGIVKRQVPGIESNFLEELKGYAEALQQPTPKFLYDNFDRMKSAIDPKTKAIDARAMIDAPFMAYIFTHPQYRQPRMRAFGRDQLREFMAYLLTSQQNSSCKLE
ncbi:MAG TPA: hypothetical protein VJK03_01650 [Candidatus Nanoarchaeia archaeon]|nr:hypothetical protein [Candidatus Nanoarchaeia archaeon]